MIDFLHFRFNIFSLSAGNLTQPVVPLALVPMELFAFWPRRVRLASVTIIKSRDELMTAMRMMMVLQWIALASAASIWSPHKMIGQRAEDCNGCFNTPSSPLLNLLPLFLGRIILERMLQIKRRYITAKLYQKKEAYIHMSPDSAFRSYKSHVKHQP